MALVTGAAGTLYHLNLKINTDQRGFNFKAHLVGASYAAVQPGAVAIAAAMLGCLPTDAEVFYATLSNDNTQRDSVFLRGAIGPGTYKQTGTPPPAELFDNPRSCLLIRVENTGGGSVTRKLNPLPDEVITDASLVAAIPDIVGPPGAAPAAPAPANTYAQAVGLFMSTFMFFSKYVQAGHPPGGAFQYDTWQNAYVLRQGVKKGGRVFI